MFESDIVLNQSFVMGVFDLQLLCYTRADERKPVGYSHLFTRIYCGAHKRTLYREKLRKKLGDVSLQIRYECRAGLRYTAGKIIAETVISLLN